MNNNVVWVLQCHIVVIIWMFDSKTYLFSKIKSAFLQMTNTFFVSKCLAFFPTNKCNLRENAYRLCDWKDRDEKSKQGKLQDDPFPGPRPEKSRNLAQTQLSKTARTRGKRESAQSVKRSALRSPDLTALFFTASGRSSESGIHPFELWTIRYTH